jgi:hypothetical protein
MSEFKAKVAMSYKGTRIERGQIISLSDEEVRAYDPKDIEAIVAKTDVAEVEVGGEGYDAMAYPALKALCGERGLPTTGNKSVLIERLVLADKAKEGVEKNETTESSPEEADKAKEGVEKVD